MMASTSWALNASRKAWSAGVAIFMLAMVASPRRLAEPRPRNGAPQPLWPLPLGRAGDATRCRGRAGGLRDDRAPGRQLPAVERTVGAEGAEDRALTDCSDPPCIRGAVAAVTVPWR